MEEMMMTFAEQIETLKEAGCTEPACLDATLKCGRREPHEGHYFANPAIIWFCNGRA